jgi:hypothetical protein
VTTGAKWDAMNANASKMLGGHVFKARLTHRACYVDRMMSGKTGSETDTAAAKET